MSYIATKPRGENADINTLGSKMKVLTPKQIQNEAPMSDTKKGFLMLKIWGQSWSVNMGKVFKGVNREKPAMIRKGLKELKILHKKIEEQIEELI